jgi:mannose-6-phosphate isomerase-like protein (cupin superfamily)
MTPDPPQLIAPGHGENPRGGEYTLKGAREELVVSEADHRPGGVEPKPHVHREHCDCFYILEGELLIRHGDDETLVGEGGFVLAPPNLVHTYHSPEGSVRQRFVNVHAPGMGFAERILGVQRDYDQHDPPPDGGRPASDAVLLHAGEGEPLELGPTARGAIKVGADHGMGSLTVMEGELDARSPGPPPHLHKRLTDSFYVLAGTLGIRMGDQTHEAPAGSFALIPPGNVHTVSNPGDEAVRFLNISAPGGLERYLRELAADPSDFAAIAARHDVIPA